MGPAAPATAITAPSSTPLPSFLSVPFMATDSSERAFTQLPARHPSP